MVIPLLSFIAIVSVVAYAVVRSARVNPEWQSAYFYVIDNLDKRDEELANVLLERYGRVDAYELLNAAKVHDQETFKKVYEN
jgi:hypothetical protein